jgi:hypothetical protein
MDTLGTITPQITPDAENEHRTEAMERLRYLGQSGRDGLLVGAAGTGKTRLFGQLASQLRREGIAVAQVNLTGVGGPEIAHQIACRLGLGLPLQTMEFETWARLQDYAESARATRRKMAFLVDHLDRARESVFLPISRLMDLFGDNCAWLLASRSLSGDRWQSFLSERSWLRVELRDLQPRESAQMLSKDGLVSPCPVRFTPEGMTAAHELTGGRMRSLNQLLELATLALEAEGLEEIDAELVHALAEEVCFAGQSV